MGFLISVVDVLAILMKILILNYDVFIMKKKRYADGDTDNENSISDYGITYERTGFRYSFMFTICILSQYINEIKTLMS